MELSSWTKSHFCAYILLCIAHADSDIADEEIKTIENFLNELHIKDKIEQDTHQVLTSVFPVFHSHSRDLRENFVRTKWKIFFIEEDEICDIMDEIENMILVDNNIEKEEIKTYAFIRKAMNIHD